MTDREPDRHPKVTALWKVDAVAQALGVTLRSVDADTGTVEVALDVDEPHLGSLGQLHGGVLFTLADIAMSYASNGGEATAMATTARIDFLAPTSTGETIIARAVAHHRGRKSTIYDVTIRTFPDDRMVATFRGTTLQV